TRSLRSGARLSCALRSEDFASRLTRMGNDPMEDLYINNFNIILTLITIVVVIAVVLGVCAYSTFYERKIAGWVQDRKGPNRVGPFGLLQPIADGLKFLLKEGMIPRHVDRFFYLAAPSIGLIMALMAFAVVPFGPTSVPPESVQRAWPQTVPTTEAEIKA